MSEPPLKVVKFEPQLGGYSEALRREIVRLARANRHGKVRAYAIAYTTSENNNIVAFHAPSDRVTLVGMLATIQHEIMADIASDREPLDEPQPPGA